MNLGSYAFMNYSASVWPRICGHQVSDSVCVNPSMVVSLFCLAMLGICLVACVLGPRLVLLCRRNRVHLEYIRSTQLALG